MTKTPTNLPQLKKALLKFFDKHPERWTAGAYCKSRTTGAERDPHEVKNERSTCFCLEGAAMFLLRSEPPATVITLTDRLSKDVKAKTQMSGAIALNDTMGYEAVLEYLRT